MRHRETQIPSRVSVSVNPAVPGAMILPSATTEFMWTALLDSSVMDDDPSQGRQVKSCTHTRLKASEIESSIRPFWRASYWDPVPLYKRVSVSRLAVLPRQVPSAANVPWNDMTAALSSKLSGNFRSSSMLMATIKEIPQTIQMVRNPFGLMRKDWRRVVLKKTAKQLHKESANLWLESQYGWGAFSYDLGNFAKAIGKLSSQTYECENLAAGTPFDENRTISTDPPFSGWLYSGSGIGDTSAGKFNLRSIDCVTNARLFCRTAHAIRQVSRFVQGLHSLGLDNRGLVNTMWEVIPYSFLVDWFIKLPNVMDPLSRIDLERQACMIGRSTKTVWRFDSKFTLGWNFDDDWGSFGYTSADGDTILEGTMGSITLYNRVPGLDHSLGIQLDGNLSTTQLASLGSLLIQVITK